MIITVDFYDEHGNLLFHEEHEGGIKVLRAEDYPLLADLWDNEDDSAFDDLTTE